MRSVVPLLLDRFRYVSNRFYCIFLEFIHDSLQETGTSMSRSNRNTNMNTNRRRDFVFFASSCFASFALLFTSSTVSLNPYHDTLPPFPLLLSHSFYRACYRNPNDSSNAECTPKILHNCSDEQKQIRFLSLVVFSEMADPNALLDYCSPVNTLVILCSVMRVWRCFML